MSALELLQIILYFSLLIACVPLLGGFMVRVFAAERNLLTPVLRPVENGIYWLVGIIADEEQNWKQYTLAMLLFNVMGFVVVLLLQLFQGALPLNPAGLPNVEPALAFNTATSFMTNTNWQSYAGETTMSQLTQMLGLAVQNFVSAATGIAVVIALTRGLVRRTASTLGSFWVDMTRSTLYVLLPLSIVLAVVLVSQGVVQNFSPSVEVTTLAGETQALPQGPAASQIAIKQLGTNGGGFFNTNSAHPYENPNALSNFLQVFSILVIPAALTYTYGKMVGSQKQGWVIFGVMLVLLLAGLTVMLISEYSGNPVYGTAAMLEGKEVRFGIANSILWGSVTTAASNGSVNAMHSSFSPLAGGIAMLNIMLGEVVFGGVGAGLYGILIFVILTVFIAGLMVGRTPEYLGKKIESWEIKMAILAILLPSAAILLFTALASVTDAGLSSRANAGAHGLSEMLYAFTSAAGNNGSAFAGLNANVPFYNILLGLTMWVGRFGVILPALAIAGSMVGKKVAPPSPGTFPTDGLLFGVLLVAVILIVGALTFFPALSLGPIVEQLLMNAGRTF
ncbi:MAG: potassium-transporting ATPase subunit KdpA [Chloroflexi bacterium]|nr:potassium-transporting ATPase subunit KdpA [Chloroflexota bacterium]MCC6896661.1 potassium-transporting ATPase subunit KdpA [Anaerolineae bacterium]